MKNKNKFIEEYDSHHSNYFDDPDDKYHEAVCQSMDDVNEALEGADVDTDDRRIIWKDGVRLTVDETANRIKKQSNVDIEHIKRGILTWLEMEFVPADMNQKQMEIFEEKITNWIKVHDKERINPKDIGGILFNDHGK
jgi:hypothetical protein